MQIIPIILSGGSGTRLWPLSRASYPKQFLAFNSKQSLFQNTVKRALEATDNTQKPWVVCSEKHAFLIQDQLTSMGIHESCLLVEPSSQDTAAAILLATLEAMHTDEDAIVWIMPSDHTIDHPNSLYEGLKKAIKQANLDHIVTFGITPSHPNTHYGYIEKGDALNEGAFKVKIFTEKPDANTAQKWVDGKKHLWNSGMFVFKAKTLLSLVEQINPALLEACKAAQKTRFNDLDFIKYDKTAYQAIEAKSFDYAIMEHTHDGIVIPLDMNWNDLGTWQNIQEHSTPKDASNAIIGNVVAKDSDGCYLHASSRLVVAMGLKNQIVVETPDAILVADKSKSHDVKNIVKELAQSGHSEATEHPLVYRPWGSYQTLILSERFQVKMLSIKPGARLSKQKHLHRAEHWVVVAGTAKVLRGEDTLTLTENQSVYIPIDTIHYIENPGHIELKIIEVQTGSYLGEDDIIRLEDRYGRVGR